MMYGGSVFYPFHQNVLWTFLESLLLIILIKKCRTHFKKVKLRERLADKYKTCSEEDSDLANEWWDKFCALPVEKLERAKSIISLNKFREEDYECTDSEILEILSYYRITRDIAEGNI